MQGFAGLVVIALVVAVYLDAKNIGVKPKLLPGLLKWGPTGWAAWSLFLNIIAIPLYAFYARPKYIAAVRSTADGQALPAPSKRFPILAGIGVGFLVVAASAGSPKPRHVTQQQGSLGDAFRAGFAEGARLDQPSSTGRAEYTAAYARVVQAAASPGSGSDDCDIFRVILCGANGCVGTMPKNCGEWPSGFAATLLKQPGFQQGGWTNREQLCLIHRLEDRYLPANRGGNGKADLQEAITFCRSSANPW